MHLQKNTIYTYKVKSFKVMVTFTKHVYHQDLGLRGKHAWSMIFHDILATAHNMQDMK